VQDLVKAHDAAIPARAAALYAREFGRDDRPGLGHTSRGGRALSCPIARAWYYCLHS
jgi:hypothetical protein